GRHGPVLRAHRHRPPGPAVRGRGLGGGAGGRAALLRRRRATRFRCPAAVQRARWLEGPAHRRAIARAAAARRVRRPTDRTDGPRDGLSRRVEPTFTPNTGKHTMSDHWKFETR